MKMIELSKDCHWKNIFISRIEENPKINRTAGIFYPVKNTLPLQFKEHMKYLTTSQKGAPS